MSDHPPEFEERRVPKAPGCPLEFTTEPRLGRIEQQLGLIIRSLGAEELRGPGLPPGMIQRQDAQEHQLADHEQRLTSMEEADDARVTKQGDRAWAIAWDLAKAGLSAAMGAAGALAAMAAGKPGHP